MQNTQFLIASSSLGRTQPNTCSVALNSKQLKAFHTHRQEEDPQTALFLKDQVMMNL